MSDRVIYNGFSERSVREKVEGILSSMGGMSNFVKPGNLVLIKPNFVAPFPHATTSLEVLEAVVDSVRRCGGQPVIAESSGYEFDTEVTFKTLGAYEFASKIDVRLVNLDKARYTRARLARGSVRDVKIPKLVLDADVLINVPKLKRHSVTRATIGIKNLFGFLHRESRCKIHSLGLERAILELAKMIRSHLVIVDGTTISERAVFGAQRALNLIVGSDSVYAADLFCCRFLGVHPRDVGHIRLALDEGLMDEKCTAVSVETEKLSVNFPGVDKRARFSAQKGLLRAGYKMMYSLEIPYKTIMKGRSLIPVAHFYFGIRPWLDRAMCDDCGDCVRVCPVNAIRIPQKEIDAALCMRVRCMRCVRACPRRAIRVRGREIADAAWHVSHPAHPDS